MTAVFGTKAGEGAAVSAATSASNILKRIEENISLASTGALYHANGEVLPW